MSDPTDRLSPFEQPVYIVWTLFYVAAFSFLQWGVLAGLYCAIYGIPKFSDWMLMQVPEYSQTALWKGRMWYPVIKIGPNNPPGRATLASLDPEHGDTRESKITIAYPISGMLAVGDQFWTVSPTSVVCVDGEQVVERKPKRVLNQPCQPFLYHGKLTIVDSTSTSPPVLLVFENNEWEEVGAIAIPTALTTSEDGERTVLIPTPPTTSFRTVPLGLQVVSNGGELHMFVSDGLTVAYRQGFELTPASALAPSNVSGFVDLCHVEEWQIVCQVPSKVGLRAKNSWKAVFLDGKPVIVLVASQIPQANPHPFPSDSLLSLQRIGGTWRTSAEVATPNMIDFLAASDGQTTYAAGQSPMQTLRFYRLTDTEFQPTGAVIKTPVAAFQPALERVVKFYQWVFWIGLLVYVIGISKLMKWYCDPIYQFGNSTVELASTTRRGIARAIDHMTYMIPNYFVTAAFGLSDQAQAEKNLDKVFDSGPDGFFVKFTWMFLSILLFGFSILCWNCWLQGRWGVTLGKWLCGIRTVRATLRPCGFLRAMLRELLLAVDLLLGITVIPGTLMIALTNCRQRAGDLVADTIVIRKPHATRND